MPKQRKNRPFSYYLFLSILTLIVILVVGITIGDYFIAEKNFEDNANLLKNETEHNVRENVKTIDNGLKMFDNTLNRQMEEAFEIFRQAYRDSGGDPASMDLAALKRQLGGKMDLYVINESGVVEYTTFPPDQGLDFKTTVPYFYDYLNEIRYADGVFNDRVVQEISTGNLRKFAYAPSYDHKYVLELGLAAESFKSQRNSLKYTDSIEATVSKNPLVKDFRIFTTSKRLVRNKSYIPDSELSAILDRAFSEQTDIVIDDPVNHTSLKYLYVDLRDPDYGADMSLVVELNYDNTFITDSVNQLVIFHLSVAVIALLAGLIMVVGISRYLTRPIQSISRDMDIIAKGNLDHPIAPVMGTEISALAGGIDRMVEELKGIIVQLQESQQNLSRSEERYRTVVQSQTEYITRFLPDGTITFANDAYCRAFGLDCENARGRKFRPNLPEEDKKLVAGYFSRLTPDHPVDFIEHRVIMPDGTVHWQQWSDRAIFDPEGHVTEYQSVGRDITEKKRIEEELLAFNEKLEQMVYERTSQLESANRELESFSYSVSHDLRSPLRAIDGYSTIILNEFGEALTPATQRYLSKIRENVRQMNRLIEDLLGFSRASRQELHIIDVDPEIIARDAYGELRQEWDGREVEFVAGPMPHCRADPMLLRLVYMNLLSNALKFTRPRSVAKIEVGSLPPEDDPVYYVKDNGVGFDMEYSHKIFGVFQRLHTDEQFEGTGVGLAIVQRIIQKHGGKIWVQSLQDKGTTFFFTLGGDQGNE
ncbi:PAS domain S-box-containing protein [Methanolinea mesophila]|uniref:sensor histidine kinase n=1 Tax=Methanolinea mesophila TaxID=547055 RepID=UPI001AE2C544|nr:ATP-binding protein [Methanolinea mesophila]MBP1928789.1 PAS domain S-box-containing protein [Methanolinea mesophila]